MNDTRNQYHLLNFLKIMVLIAIQSFHAWEFIFYLDPQQLGTDSVIHHIMSYHARSLVIGGQILVAIIYLLFGFTQKNTAYLLKIALFALLGQLALTLAFMEDSGFWQSLEWDIYAFIFSCNLLLMLIPIRYRDSAFIMSFSLVWLLVPTTFWQTSFPAGFFFDVLTGRMVPGNSGAWAMLPWFFHALLFFSLGAMIKKHLSFFQAWHKNETFLWPIVLFPTLPYLGAYFHVPIGPSFYWFTFNRPMYIYWANFLPFVFLMRIAFLNQVQSILSGNALMLWMSNLMWSKNVGVTYLIAIVYLGMGADFEDVFATVPYAFDLFYFSIMPVAEILARLIVYSGIPQRLRGVISSR